MKFWIIALLSVSASAVPAQTVTFEADGDAKMIRCYEKRGDAVCEMVVPANVMMFSCIALDAQGEPIASAAMLGNLPTVDFPNLDTSRIDNVLCRRSGPSVSFN